MKMLSLTSIEENLLKTITEIIDNDFSEIIDDKLKISICDYLLEGNLFIKYDFLPKEFTYEKELRYDIDNFDWDIVYQPIPSPCQLYLHSFNHIKYLIQGYELTLNEKYMDLASNLIKSWLNYEPHSKNNFTWLKDSGPDRAIIMIYFILLSKKNNISKYVQLISDMNISLKKHANFFYSDNNYKPNNHGTMIDRALYLVAIYLNDTSSAKHKKSVDRLVSALERNFSDKMVNLESAIAYHLLNLELFIRIEAILNRFGDSFGIDQTAIENAIDFLIYSTKPDLYLPIIGDSHRQKINSIKNYSFYPRVQQYPPLRWLLTSKKSGLKPKELLRVYEKEGFAFFRSAWDKYENETFYTSFISGSGNPDFITHKHADDLSFTLFAKGKDIFVDSGTYSYELGDMRNFFISALAHNTLVVDDQTYPIHLWAGSGDFSKTVENQNNPNEWGDVSDTGILDYGDEEDYCYVVGKNDMYDGVNITRSLHMLKNECIVIVDDIQSYDIHEYSQYYHLNPKININDVNVKLEDKTTKVVISGDEIKVNIFQIGQCDFNLIKGDENKAGPGIISETYGYLEETNSLKFSLKSKNSRFITLITVNKIKEEDEIKFYIESNPRNKSNEELVIRKSEKQIKIPLIYYSRKIFKNHRNLVLKQNDRNLFTFTITGANDNESYAWYIMKNGKKVDIIWYSPNPVLNYLFTEPGNYQIKYFIKKGENKEMHTFHKIISVTDEDISESKINFGP